MPRSVAVGAREQLACRAALCRHVFTNPARRAFVRTGQNAARMSRGPRPRVRLSDHTVAVHP